VEDLALGEVPLGLALLPAAALPVGVGVVLGLALVVGLAVGLGLVVGRGLFVPVGVGEGDGLGLGGTGSRRASHCLTTVPLTRAVALTGAAADGLD